MHLRFIYTLLFVSLCLARLCQAEAIYSVRTGETYGTATISIDDEKQEMIVNIERFRGKDSLYLRGALQTEDVPLTEINCEPDQKSGPATLTGMPGTLKEVMSCVLHDQGKSQPVEFTHLADIRAIETSVGSEQVKVTTNVPQLRGKTLLVKLLQKALDKEARLRRRELMSEAREAIVFEDMEARFDCNTRYEIKYINEEIASVLIVHYMYTGGAHGNTDFEVRNYALRDGVLVQLELDDLFGKEALKNQICSLYYKKCHDLGASSITEGSMKSLSPESLTTFTLTPSGMTVHFPPYALGCYAEGCYEPTIPWSELKPFLTEKSIARRFVK